MGYPENMDWAAYDARYGTGGERAASQDAWGAAALYYLALALGHTTDGLGDDVDEALYECGIGKDDPEYDFAWEDFGKRYRDKPLDAAADLVKVAARKLRNDAKRAVIAFIAGLFEKGE